MLVKKITYQVRVITSFSHGYILLRLKSDFSINRSAEIYWWSGAAISVIQEELFNGASIDLAYVSDLVSRRSMKRISQFLCNEAKGCLFCVCASPGG